MTEQKPSEIAQVDPPGEPEKTGSPRWSRTTKLAISFAGILIIFGLIIKLQNYLSLILTAFLISFLFSPLITFFQKRLKLSWRLATALGGPLTATVRARLGLARSGPSAVTAGADEHPVHPVEGADIGVAQLGLGLSFELGIGELDGDHRRDALPAVIAGDLVVALDDAVFHAIGIQHPGQRRLEAGLVHTAFRGARAGYLANRGRARPATPGRASPAGRAPVQGR